MSTVTLPLLTGLIASVAVILVMYLKRESLEKLAVWWGKMETRKMYNYMYSIGAYTREQYLEKIKELEEDE